MDCPSFYSTSKKFLVSEQNGRLRRCYGWRTNWDANCRAFFPFWLEGESWGMMWCRCDGGFSSNDLTSHHCLGNYSYLSVKMNGACLLITEVLLQWSVLLDDGVDSWAIIILFLLCIDVVLLYSLFLSVFQIGLTLSSKSIYPVVSMWIYLFIDLPQNYKPNFSEVFNNLPWIFAQKKQIPKKVGLFLASLDPPFSK